MIKVFFLLKKDSAVAVQQAVDQIDAATLEELSQINEQTQEALTQLSITHHTLVNRFSSKTCHNRTDYYHMCVCCRCFTVRQCSTLQVD